MLLLQGQANSHQWWRRVRPLLTGDFRTITFDYRGTGETARRQSSVGVDPTPWTTRLFADDAAAVLAALGVDRALVYGTSMGGRVAQELAINHPRLVERLVLCCTSPGGALARERSHEVRKALADPDAARRHRSMVDLFNTPEWVAAQGGYDHAPRHLLGDRTMTPSDANRHLRMSGEHDASDRLHLVEASTLIVHAQGDRMAPVANAAALHERLRGSELHVHPEGRHGFFDEFAQPVTDLVGAFLSRRALR
ncbi:alpha/beta fold hydrolase [Calidifontibacter indicus]|uniref:alpha/beta fold hydrolase n=1 Tax=Calidifontibacter indicus TaxID=419650 RepID=UPI001FE636AA|nr:alpha/beta hydrolase [Calidifontibacter indicus]